MKKIWLGILLGMYALTAKAQPITVAASFSILADITRQIGQDRVKVIEIVGAEKDVHAFQPSPADVKKIAEAKLVLINGLGLEGWITRMVNASGHKDKVVRVAEQLPSLLKVEEQGHHHHHHGHDHGHDHYDPHVWQDPVLMKEYVHHIAQALIAVDPNSKAYYEANAKAYHLQLDALNSWVEQSLATIPVAKRRVITSHDAFAYLGHRYKIQFMSPQGSSTESEASAKEVATLVQHIRKTGVRALFIENISSPRLMETLAKEANVKVGGKLYSDALAKTAPANTYLGMYRYNIETLLAGLRQN
jgi:zinc/manganese transport system substrate-binding protein